jgi:hypothetical protein
LKVKCLKLRGRKIQLKVGEINAVTRLSKFEGGGKGCTRGQTVTTDKQEVRIVQISSWEYSWFLSRTYISTQLNFPGRSRSMFLEE